MKKLVGLIFLGLIVFIAIYRQRVFLRDPLATVSRDGHTQGDVKVMINYNNDILMDDSSATPRRVYLVEGWNRTPVFLAGSIKCINGVACMTEADHATGTPVPHGSRGHGPAQDCATMTNKQVDFIDEDSAVVKVTLR